tara:strand:- start:140 stop:871 length:732 start_codon:yes stop_codon:yes gene_type:complete
MGAEKSASRSSGGGMGPGQSMAMAGNTGLASATEKQAQTIKRTTGKSFKAIGQKIGEVGSKYRRPADVEKYAKGLSTIEAGNVLGAKKFTGPDGVERVSFVGTGMKDEQGRTILSKQIPQLTAQAPTLRQLGGDIARGVMGYNTLKYTDGSNQPTMVREKGLIEMTPTMSIFNAIRGSKFFTNRDEQRSEPVRETTETAQPSDIVENNRKIRLEKLASSLASGGGDKRPFLTLKTRGFGGTMR